MPSLTPGSILSRRRAVRLGSAGLVMAVAGGQRSAAARDQTSLEANKAIARRVFEDGFNDRNAAALEELYAPDVVDHGTWARQMPGPAGMPITSDEFQALFPDMIVHVESTIAEDDLVATRVAWRGTHPPAGTHHLGRTMHIFRIDTGRIVAQWCTGWDWLTPYIRRSAPRPGNPLAVSSSDWE
jgi:predicted SnoaL-like aldol condensation-catalyzing enzyme